MAKVWFHFVLAANVCFQVAEVGKRLIEDAGVAVQMLAKVWFHSWQNYGSSHTHARSGVRKVQVRWDKRKLSATAGFLKGTPGK